MNDRPKTTSVKTIIETTSKLSRKPRISVEQGSAGELELKFFLILPIVNVAMLRIYKLPSYLSSLIIACALIESEAQFRGWDFGAKFDTITREEQSEFVRTTPVAAIFKDELFGFKTTVFYRFSPENQQLISGGYDLNCAGFDTDEVLDHLMKVRQVMDARYGSSMKKGHFWWKDKKGNDGDLVNAFRFGEVSFRYEWYGPGVIVSLVLSNELNTCGKINYSIEYRPGRDYDQELDLKKL